MSQTVTKADMDQALDVLNARLEANESSRRYGASHRYDYYGLDVFSVNGKMLRGPVIAGTKREVTTYVWAMLEGMDADQRLCR